MFRTIDGGESWQYISAVKGSPYKIKALSFSSIFLFHNYYGYYLHSTNGGLSWTTKTVEGKVRFLYPVNGALNYCLCWPSSDDRFVLFKIHDGTEDGYQKMEDIHFYVWSLSGFTKQDGTTIIWLAGSDGKVGKFTDNNSVVDENVEMPVSFQ